METLFVGTQVFGEYIYTQFEVFVGTTIGGSRTPKMAYKVVGI